MSKSNTNLLSYTFAAHKSQVGLMGLKSKAAFLLETLVKNLLPCLC